MAVIENTNGSDLGVDVGSTNQGSPLAAAADGRSSGRIDETRKLRSEEEVKPEVKKLQELLSKLNPMAEEFVPPSLVSNGSIGGGSYPNGFVMLNGFPVSVISRNGVRRRGNGYGQGKRRINNRTNKAQREEVIWRTIYVSDIDQLSRQYGLSELGSQLCDYWKWVTDIRMGH